MTSPEQLESLASAMEDLRRELQALRELADPDADAAAMDQAVLRCETAFSRMAELAGRLDPALFQQGDAGCRIRHLLDELSGTYAACLQRLAAASSQVALRLAEMHKRRSASKEYEKIAGLG
ncbi:MAG: hypothetical protein H5U10_18665 [Desulfacinum sp.]|nr:hypothetical protein [Desulfacinum sp.]